MSPTGQKTMGSSHVPARRKLVNKPTSLADKIFYRVAASAANFSIALVLLILAFLLWRSLPALQSQGIDFVFGSNWDPTAETPVFQIWPMLWGSILISALGVIIAVPMAIAVAYFIEFLASKPIAKIATVLIDLLAALPSVVLGLWGFLVFTPVAAGWAELLNKYFGWFPLFVNNSEGFVASPFIAGWIVSIMIVPIIASISREIFSQIDKDLINAAKGLGGSSATIFRKVILPTASGGVVGGVLLGLGRALGETVAIYFVLNLVFDTNWFNILEQRGGSIASHVLSRFGEASEAEVSALMASGLVLFIMTLIINLIAAWIVNKAQPWRKI
jgi:phosphate transport system permease protein